MPLCPVFSCGCALAFVTPRPLGFAPPALASPSSVIYRLPPDAEWAPQGADLGAVSLFLTYPLGQILSTSVALTAAFALVSHTFRCISQDSLEKQKQNQ